MCIPGFAVEVHLIPVTAFFDNLHRIAGMQISDNLLIHAGTGTKMQTGDPRHHRTSLLLGLFAADIVFFAAHRNDQVPIRIRRDLIAIRQNLHVRVDFDAVGIVRFPRICAFCCIRLLCSGTDRRVLLHIIARIGKCSGRKGSCRHHAGKQHCYHLFHSISSVSFSSSFRFSGLGTAACAS